MHEYGEQCPSPIRIEKPVGWPPPPLPPLTGRRGSRLRPPIEPSHYEPGSRTGRRRSARSQDRPRTRFPVRIPSVGAPGPSPGWIAGNPAAAYRDEVPEAASRRRPIRRPRPGRPEYAQADQQHTCGRLPRDSSLRKRYERNHDYFRQAQDGSRARSCLPPPKPAAERPRRCKVRAGAGSRDRPHQRKRQHGFDKRRVLVVVDEWSERSRV